MALADQIHLLKATDLIGKEVVNLQGEGLGKLEEIMIDAGTGMVGYAVLSFGGVLGMGDKLFAVPWASLTWDESQGKLTMDAHKDRLKNAPGFDKNDWPKTPNGQWMHDVYGFYGKETHWPQTP